MIYVGKLLVSANYGPTLVEITTASRPYDLQITADPLDYMCGGVYAGVGNILVNATGEGFIFTVDTNTNSLIQYSYNTWHYGDKTAE